MILLKVILLFSLWKVDDVRANETVSLITRNSEKLEMENLLTEFLTDLKSSYFEKLKPYRMVILSKIPHVLQTTKILLENGTPYLINTKPEAIVLPPHFGANSVILFFIDDLNDFQLKTTFDRLPDDYECRTLIISSTGNTPDVSIAMTILSAVNMKLRNIMMARLNGRVIRFYGRLLNADCEQEITLINKWIPSRGFTKNRNVLGHDLVMNERGCRNIVSTFEIFPTMIIREDENKLLRIAGGIEGQLISTIAKYLNMELVVNLPLVKTKYQLSSDGTVAGIIGDVAREVATLGIGQIRPTLERAKIVDMTTPHGHECIVWTVPFVTKYNYNVVTSEFTFMTWVIVLFSIASCCGLTYAVSKMKIGCRSPLSVLDVIAMTLNYTIPRPPTSLLCKLFFLLYLNYSRVISIAYSTSLSSILTATILDPAIVDEDGILAAGLRTAGTQNSLSVLVNQILPNSTTGELINRYEILNSPEEALKRITDHQDLAYLRHKSTIRAVASKLILQGEKIKFYSLPDCVISYYSVIVTPKGSRLTGEINHIMQWLHEAGIYNYWAIRTRTRIPLTITEVPNNHTLARLKSIFLLYLFCLIPACLAFATELIIFKLKLNWFTH